MKNKSYLQAPVLAAILLVSSLMPAWTQTELIVNGGFESGSSSWTFAGDAHASTSYGFAHSGSYYLWLGRTVSSSDSAYQTITIPANATTATLSFYYNINSLEVNTVIYDTFSATIRNTSGTVMATVGSWSNINQDGGPGNPYYHQVTFNLLAYAGQTIRIYFSSVTDSTKETNFRVDDVSVSVTTGTTVTVPTVTAQPATLVATTSARIWGRIQNDGGASIIERRLEWGVSGTWSDFTSSVTVSGNDFYYDLSGLSPNTAYQFRAWAKNSAGWGTSGAAYFTTGVSSCSYSLNSYSANPGSGSGSSSFTVTTGSSCTWQAVSDATSWLHASSSTTGNGTVNYTYDANSNSSSRTGHITVQGQTFTVTQAGSSSMTRQGVDYSFDRPSPSGLKAAGYDFAIRYVSPPPNDKNITFSEAQALQNAGIDIIIVFESTAGRILDGYNAGVADANTAISVATAAGAPQNFFCYFTCDFDAQLNHQTAINAYLDGAAVAFGSVDRVGFYGGYYPLKRVLDAGKAAKGWQTTAWSNSNKDSRISLYQHQYGVTIAGGECDINDGYGSDLGQWSTVSTPTKIIELSGDLAFGVVLNGSSAQRTLTIANTGTSPLTVSSISYPSGFSGTWSGTIQPGLPQNVTVTFSPAGGIGPYYGTVTVNSDKTSGLNTILASGTGGAPTTVPITIASSTSGLGVSVDGAAVVATPVVFNWTPGQSHSISMTTQYSYDSHTRYSFTSWSDSGAQSHTITPTAATTYTATFSTQYLLDTTASPLAQGTFTLSPASSGNWFDPGQVVQVTAAPISGYTFSSWSGDAAGSANPATVTMNGYRSVTANFIPTPPTTVAITLAPSPAGRSVMVDNTTIYTTPVTLNWTAGSTHTIAATAPSYSTDGHTKYLFSSWSDGGSQSHTIAPTATSTYTATFSTQYLLDTTASPLANGTFILNPASAGNWFDPGQVVQVTAAPISGYTFSSWSGDATGSANPATVTMNGYRSVTANFTAIAQPAGTLQFSQAAASVSEGAGTVVLLVTRTGGSSGAVRVSYATANGTATAPSDYTAISGTLNWASGDAASKPITVAIANDTIPESSETFTVTLSAPTGGATLGTIPTATVTITDDDAVAGRVVRIASQSVGAGGSVTVPVQLASQGDENALGFSINFDTALLTFVSVAAGSGASGATLNPNNSQATSGRIGVALSLPASQHFAAGVQEVVLVTFQTAGVSSTTSTPVTFGNQPIAQEISDAAANVLSATFQAGTVDIAVGYESDLTPSPNGNGAVSITDWVKVGRLAAGLDTPANAAEFQRADCAPRKDSNGNLVLGNGAISITDWVQAGRYAAGLDPLTPAGGPSSAIAPAAVKTGQSTKVVTAAGREIRIVSTSATPGGSLTVSIQLIATGDENALGYSVTFDPAQLTFVAAVNGTGTAGATLNVQPSQVALGRLGLAQALGAGLHFNAGTIEVVRITFTAAPAANSALALGFGNVPIAQEVSNVEAATLPTTFTAGTVTVTPVPQITSPLNAAGTVGQAFSYTIAANNSPITFNATSLPPGLSANTANGQITGTPTGAGTFNVAISAANSAGTDTKTLVVTVGLVRPSITSPITAAGRVGQAFSYTITADNAPTSFGATGLPAGLAVNSANGQITGTPTVSGPFSVNLTAVNAAGTGARTLTLTINPPTAAVPNVAGTYSGSENSTISFIENGVVIETRTISGNNPGVVITQSGTQFSFTQSATDPIGGGTISLTRTATLSGNNIVSVTGPAVGFASLPGLTITQNQITSGTGIVESGRITLNLTGRMRGVFEGDAVGVDLTSTVVFTGTVTPLPLAPVITSTLTAMGTFGQPFTYMITANSAPTLFGAAGLPVDLTLNTANGQITGTPAAGGNHTVTISAGNAGGTGSASLALTVNRAAQTISFGPLPNTLPTAAPFALTATSDSGLPVSYTSSTPGVATVSGSMVTLTRVEGTTILTAAQAGNANYLPATSVSQTLSVFASSPGISVHPTNQTNCVGSNVTFTVMAIGQGGPFAYQWRSNGMAIAEATTSSLTLNNIQTNYEAGYDVLVSNATNTVTSGTAMLVVNFMPYITTPPADLTVVRGQSASFTVAATGKPAPRYQWRKNGTAIPGATSATFNIPTVASTDATSYDVLVFNSCGTNASAAVTLTVNGPVEITQTPQSQTVRVGETATFRVVAAGTPPLSYQWRRNGANIPSATTDTLTLTSVPITEDQTTYDVIVSNVVGSAPASPSPAARLTVVQPPVITRAPQSITVLPGTTVTFSVEATGTAPLSYQWKKDASPINGATSSSYTVANAQAANIGAYTVVVSNAQGSDERTALLNVVSRQLKVGDVQVTGATVGSVVNVPITLVGDGTEHKVSLSVAFDPAVVTYSSVPGGADVASRPVIAAVTGATVTVNNPGGGQPIGVTVEMPAGQTFPAGASEVARLVFAAASASQVACALVQGDAPVARQVLDTNNASLPSEFANGSVTLKQPVSPVIADATGLLGEVVAVSTPPGSSGGGYVRVLIYDLGVDRLGNAIRVFNATGTTAAGIPYVIIPAPTPGTPVNVALEYYVSDRTTVPTPRFVVETTPTGPPAVAGPEMQLTAGEQRGFVNGLAGGFYLNFRTVAGGSYYVQYRDNATEAWRTSFPVVPGNGGYVQWIDNGPPRTSSPPGAGTTRFYQVIRSR